MSDFNTTELTAELGSNFIEYAVSVNTDRAIPDATSGLKPVARRILYDAYEQGIVSSKPHVKCATIVGDVIGKYHPHGDSSVYGALVRLSQLWVMRYPLIDFHGNMGNIGGDGPAAYRYTEARLAKITEDGLMNGLKKNNVPFMPTFDDRSEEPTTLPAIFPNLLCNPNTGIGVAMACNFAPHNLKEVSNAILDYMEGKEPMLPGPDFPGGGIVINKDDVPAIMATGHGSVKLRGRYKIEKNNLVFYEIPFGVATEDLLKEIGELCDKKELDGISHIRDESNKKGLRLVIECEKEYNPDQIANLLFAKTDLQTSFSYNQVALVNKTPTELNLKQCIEIYVKHNIECIVKEALFDKKKYTDRQEIVQGLLKALEDIDNIIALIKNSQSSAAAKANLIEKYKFTDNQAKAILDMKLAKLSGLERVEIEKEAQALEEALKSLNALLASDELQKQELKERLLALVQKYGDERRTQLMQLTFSKEEKETAAIIPEDCVVILTNNGDIKRVPAAAFKTQKRAGKGVKTIDGGTLATISTNTVDNLLIFTNKGKMYRVLVDKIPVGTQATKGGRIGDLIAMDIDEKISAVTTSENKQNKNFVIFITKNGLLKKSLLTEYKDGKKTTGIQAIKLGERDAIVSVHFCDNEEFILFTKKGMSIHFETAAITPIGRVTAGVKSIKLADGDEVVAAVPVTANLTHIAVITAKGYGKKIPLDMFPVQGRYGKGLSVVHNIETAGEVVAATPIKDTDNLLLTGIPNSICIAATELPQLGRVSAGNILIKGSTIQSVTVL